VLTFNTLLAQANLEPERVYLLRHQDPKRLPAGRLFSAWMFERKKFEEYQRHQKWKNRFDGSSSVASFVVAPDGATLFVGLYKVTKVVRASGPLDDPLIGNLPNEDRAIHTMERSPRWQNFEGKLVVDWGKGERAWRQRAHKKNKPILEIRKAIKEVQFPGYISFISRVADLPRLPNDWTNRFKEVRGVYVLTFDDGQLYIGSASGTEGFWQRWNDYIRNGHGGNRILIRDGRDTRKDATVSILEFTGSALSRDEVIKREMFWQRKLGSRTILLDKNEE